MGNDYSDLHRVVSVDPSLDASNSVSAQNQKWLEKYRVVQQFMDNDERGLLSGSIVIPDDLLDSIMLSGDSIAGLPASSQMQPAQAMASPVATPAAAAGGCKSGG